MDYRKIFAMKQQRKKSLIEKFKLPETSGVYGFIRKVNENELDSNGLIKTGNYECYIGQAKKNLLDRCASHYMPFSYNHLAISLSKRDNGEIFFNEVNTDLDGLEKYTIEHYDFYVRQSLNLTETPLKEEIKLFNNSSGGQGNQRGKHLEDSDFKKNVEQKKMSVEARAKRKLEKHIEESLEGKKYFRVNVNAGNYEIVIYPYLECGKKEGGLKENAIKAFNKILKMLEVENE